MDLGNLRFLIVFQSYVGLGDLDHRGDSWIWAQTIFFLNVFEQFLVDLDDLESFLWIWTRCCRFEPQTFIFYRSLGVFLVDSDDFDSIQRNWTICGERFGLMDDFVDLGPKP